MIFLILSLILSLCDGIIFFFWIKNRYGFVYALNKQKKNNFSSIRIKDIENSNSFFFILSLLFGLPSFILFVFYLISKEYKSLGSFFIPIIPFCFFSTVCFSPFKEIYEHFYSKQYNIETKPNYSSDNYFNRFIVGFLFLSIGSVLGFLYFAVLTSINLSKNILLITVIISSILFLLSFFLFFFQFFYFEKKNKNNILSKFLKFLLIVFFITSLILFCFSIDYFSNNSQNIKSFIIPFAISSGFILLIIPIVLANIFQSKLLYKFYINDTAICIEKGKVFPLIINQATFFCPYYSFSFLVLGSILFFFYL